jgi:hypothetical protein
MSVRDVRMGGIIQGNPRDRFQRAGKYAGHWSTKMKMKMERKMKMPQTSITNQPFRFQLNVRNAPVMHSVNFKKPGCNLTFILGISFIDGKAH